MGIVYGVGCKQCKVWRDLDKMSCLWMDPREPESQAWEEAKELPDNGVFSAYLLATFMADHKGHDCTLFDDQACIPEADLGFTREDKNYWVCSL